MTQAWKCNKCGKLFTRTWVVQIKAVFDDPCSDSNKLEFGFEPANLYNGWQYCPRSSADFCPRCIKDIVREWLRAEDEEEKERAI